MRIDEYRTLSDAPGQLDGRLDGSVEGGRLLSQFMEEHMTLVPGLMGTYMAMAKV